MGKCWRVTLWNSKPKYDWLRKVKVALPLQFCHQIEQDKEPNGNPAKPEETSTPTLQKSYRTVLPLVKPSHIQEHAH